MASCTLQGQETVAPHVVRKSLKSADLQGIQKKAKVWYWTKVGKGRAMKCASILCLVSVFIPP